ncbi:MAG: hypothetical protein AB3N33_11570 [Puniceicoccaceae bacterium]
MLERLRESWSKTPSNTKSVLVLFGVAIVSSLLVMTIVISNWQKDVPAETEDLSKHATRDLNRMIRQANTGKGPVQLLGIAEKAVLDRHLTVIGGIENISAISSVRFSGRVTFEDGLVQEVVVVKKGGDRMRTSVRSKVTQTSWVVSPDSNWRAVWVNGNLRDVRDLADEELEDSLRYINVVSELYLAQQNEWDLRYLGVKDFNYRMAHVFEVKMAPRHIVEFYISPKTFLDVGRVEKIFEDDGTLNITRRLHRGHFDANGFMLPGFVETYINDKLIQKFRLESAVFNAGVLDSVFERPVVDTTP